MFDAKRLKRLYDQDAINSQFLHSIFCEEYEKNMIDEILQKRVMNGQVVPMIEKPKHDKIVDETNSWVKVFYQGEPLTDLEIDIQRMYLNAKVLKHQ